MLRNLQSHRRLIFSMGLSSVVALALLEFLSMLISNTACRDAWCFDELNFLTVYIERQKVEPISEVTLPDHRIRTAPELPAETATAKSADTAPVDQGAERDEQLNLPREMKPVRDWYAIAKDSANQIVGEHYRQEEIRQSMWRSTGSVMFKDTDGFDFHEPATVIADREFRVPVGVLGIGITIGGCFFGIPLAGIPVERRTAGPNVIYCTDIYE